MSSQPDDGDAGRGQLKKHIMDVRIWVNGLKTDYQFEQPNIRAQTDTEFRRATLKYYNLLREYRGESAIKEKWEQEGGPIELERLISGSTTVRQQTAGHGAGPEAVEMPLIKTVDLSVIEEAADVLDDIANDLGFTANVTESTPRTEINDELIEEVEEWRQKKLK